MSYTTAGKPLFEKEGQIFIEVVDGTANVQYIQSAVQRKYEDFVLVTIDTLEIPDSHATRGLKFWKVLSRKLYAVSEGDFSKQGPLGQCIMCQFQIQIN